MNPTILIVDDEMRMRRIIADYLHIKGYETLEACDGVEALEIFHAKHPDLVILDVMMPRKDGWQVCREIRQTHHTPIIMLTARSEEEDELQGFELGADEYVAKPFSLKILSARIEAVLRRNTNTEATSGDAPRLRIDKLAREVYAGTTLIQLTYTEFELLEYLATNNPVQRPHDCTAEPVSPAHPGRRIPVNGNCILRLSDPAGGALIGI